jgi:hypothetical protein
MTLSAWHKFWLLQVLDKECVCSMELLCHGCANSSTAPLYIVGDSFGVTNDGKLSWYLDAYSLTVGTFILPAGKLRVTSS